MKKKLLNLLISSAGMLLLFSSCQKEMGSPKDDEISNTPLPGLTTYCRVESIWENPGASNQRFLLVAYDQFENPAFITTPLPSTGHPFRVFKYDNWHRLREYFGDYGNGFFEFWHFYGFDNNGRIGVDTMYTFGQLLDKPVGYFERRISWIEYDSQGRIVKISNTNNFGASWVDNFTYMASGNLMNPAATYDNKVSILRTNDIWMFLARDYSMNNPFTADAYNIGGHPTMINVPSPFIFILSDIQLNHSRVGYSCRPATF